MNKFEIYDRENPQIWQAFVHFTVQTKNKGFKKYSAKGIFELIRWHTGIKLGSDGFKVQNNYSPDYARKMMSEFPEYEGFFITRVLKAVRSKN